MWIYIHIHNVLLLWVMHICSFQHRVLKDFTSMSDYMVLCILSVFSMDGSQKLRKMAIMAVFVWVNMAIVLHAWNCSFKLMEIRNFYLVFETLHAYQILFLSITALSSDLLGNQIAVHRPSCQIKVAIEAYECYCFKVLSMPQSMSNPVVLPTSFQKPRRGSILCYQSISHRK